MNSARTRLVRTALLLSPICVTPIWTAQAKAETAQPVLTPPLQPESAPAKGPQLTREASTNLLRNPSFEDGEAHWFSFAERNPISWGGFDITDTRAHSGTHSARLLLDSTGNDRPTRIHGVIQEFKSEFAPERLSGWYLVDEWQRGTPKQYIQVVIILWGARDPSGAVRTANNLQVAYTLAGVDEAPLQIANRRFVLSGPKDPVIGEWIPFEFNPRADFKAQWGVDITNFEFVRVLYEVRYDDMARDLPAPEAKDPADPSPADPAPPAPLAPPRPARATVYYDDLHAGE